MGKIAQSEASWHTPPNRVCRAAFAADTNQAWHPADHAQSGCAGGQHARVGRPTTALTNIAAERQLRHWVIARRISFGTRSLVGANSLALLVSVIDTCRARKASATDLPARAIHAARLGLPAPALPPIPTQLLGRHGALVDVR